MQEHASNTYSQDSFFYLFIITLCQKQVTPGKSNILFLQPYLLNYDKIYIYVHHKTRRGYEATYGFGKILSTCIN